MNELEQNYLAHHGILGQRWHKRNGPPYPLDAGDHSKSEKEAGYKKSLGGGRNEELYDRKGNISARKARRLLNKHDQGRVEDEYKSKQYANKAEKYRKKEEKIAAKQEERANKTFDRDMKKVEKYGRESDKAKKILAERAEDANRATAKFNKEHEKFLKNKDLSEKYRSFADEHKKAAEQMLNEISESHEFNVSSTDIKRIANRGEVYAANMIGTFIAGPLAGVAASAGTAKYGEGKVYKVKEKSKQEKANDRVLKQKADYDSVKKIVDQDKSIIAKQAAKQMAKDMVRWQKEGNENSNFAKGKNADQLAKAFEKKIMDKIMNENTGYATSDTHDGTVYFQIDGIPEFGGGQQQDVFYDPKTKKITGMYWT